MEKEQEQQNKTTIELEVEILVDIETWGSFQQLSPTAWHLLASEPDIAAIELTILPTPGFSISSAILIGSPTAWMIEDGSMVTAENTIGPDMLSEHLWHIGREAAYCGIGPWLQERKLNGKLYSILLLPNMICIREAEELEELAEKTWSNTLEKNVFLKATCFTGSLKTPSYNRLRAQTHHLKEIYCADLGTNIRLLGKSKLNTQKSIAKQT